jgi:hypothetical protein
MVAVEVLTSGFGPAEHAPNCPIGTASSEGICTCGASVRLHNDKRLDRALNHLSDYMQKLAQTTDAAYCSQCNPDNTTDLLEGSSLP